MAFFRPLNHQSSFLRATSSKGEVALLAGNRTGKSVVGGALVATTSTGLYPEGWQGRRFSGPVDWIVTGKTFEATRNIAQQILLGRDLHERLGTGLIPKRMIGRWSRRTGVPEAVDRVAVKHVSGAWSHIQFMAYEQKVEKYRGFWSHGVWCDEEAPEDIYSELLRGLTDRQGLLVLTLTPLEGMTQVVRYFWPQPSNPDRALVRAELDTCGLYPQALVDRQMAKYRPHEREARRRGIPMQGSGPVFPVSESDLVMRDFPIPDSWPRIGGLDFGAGAHPTGAALLVLEPGEKGYARAIVTRDHRGAEPTPLYHAAMLKTWGRVPIAWPHDGNRLGDVQSMQPFSQIYRGHGLMMLPSHATFPQGGFGLDAAIDEMLDWMKTGRFKVFASCQLWLEEFRQYHRKEGQIVKEHDDVISASRYAFMMRRFARAASVPEMSELPAMQAGLYSNPFVMQEEGV